MNKQFRITRRGLFWGVLGTLAVVFLSRLKKTKPAYSVHQGYTDKTSTIITVLRSELQSFRYAVLVNQSQSPKISINVKVSTQYGSSLDRLDIDGIEVGESYTLAISENGRVIEQRTFGAMDTDLREPRIAVYSCSADEWRVDHKSMWASLLSTKPDLIFSLGDNVYLDGSSYGWGVLWPVTPDPARIWRRYTDMRKNLELYRQEKLTPMIAVWDDHDFGFNGADSSYEHKDFVKGVFETFFPRPARNSLFESGPGVSMCWNSFNTCFIFLDSRYYRVMETSPAAVRTHWGSEQKQWLSSHLIDSKVPIWLLNGCQFLGGDTTDTDNDSVASRHPEDLEWLRQQVINTRQNITLISGDVHYSEVIQMPSSWGSGLYEISSSALHAIANEPSGPGTRLALTTENNFIILQPVDSSTKEDRIKVTCYGTASTPLFETTISPSR